MPNLLDIETGTRPKNPAVPVQQTTNNFFEFQTPSGPRTVRQARQQRQMLGSTTARLRRVSTQFLTSGGQEEGFDGGESGQFGRGGQSQGGGRNARSAPPISLGQLQKFVRDEAVPDSDMLNIDVTLRKEDYGAPGSSDYRKNMAMATAALSEKFGVARHKIVVGGEEGDRAKHAHVQQAIVSILHQIKEGQQRSKAMDFMDICTLPYSTRNLNSANPRDWWDGSQINLWKDLDQCDDMQVCRWQFCVNKYFCDEDCIASN